MYVLSWKAGALFLVVLLACALLAQAVPAQTANVQDQKPQVPDQGTEQKPASPGSGATQDQEKPADKSVRPTQEQQPAPKEEVKITPQQAKELFHTVDEILAFDSKKTGLPIKHQVKRKLTSRDEVVGYLEKHTNDEDTKRLKRSELVLKKFGLLPRDFNLEKLLVDLLREQVAGYYDPKTKTVNLLDWVPLEEQEPVMAHELTHALQDQSVGLQKWMKKGEKDLAEVRKNPTPADIENDEIDNARQAIVEGQAEAVMLDYALAPVGRSIEDSPELVKSMESEMVNGTSDSAVFKTAPIFLKEALTFPYSRGLEFVLKLMRTGGKEAAFAAVLKNPPHTTRQIMQPETYLSGEKIEPMPVADFAGDFKNYERFDIGAMGEFDVAVLIEQYAGLDLSKRLYPEWRGGYYYAGRPKGGDLATPLGLLYVSRWSSAEKASEFGMIYSRSLAQRYKHVVVTEDSDLPKTSGDRIVDHEESALHGKHVFQTEDGQIVIDEEGATVLVSESLDAATTETLEKEVFGK